MSNQTKTSQFKANDRVAVSDRDGFSLGYGTVLAFYPAASRDNVSLVEVALDDDGRTGLFAINRVKAVGR
jgi:hypothetical protein